jgi:hypothetical protein
MFPRLPQLPGRIALKDPGPFDCGSVCLVRHFRFLLSLRTILFSSARFRLRATVMLIDLDTAYASVDFR